MSWKTSNTRGGPQRPSPFLRFYRSSNTMVGPFFAHSILTTWCRIQSAYGLSSEGEGLITPQVVHILAPFRRLAIKPRPRLDGPSCEAPRQPPPDVHCQLSPPYHTRRT